MGLIPVFARAQSSKKSEAYIGQSSPTMGNARTAKQEKEGKERGVAGWARRRGKGGVVIHASDIAVSPASPRASTPPPETHRLPVQAGAASPPSLATPGMASSGLASRPAPPSAVAPLTAQVITPPNGTSATSPDPPRQVLPPRIPSVMYCPVLDKQGFGYGNEERRRADFL